VTSVSLETTGAVKLAGLAVVETNEPPPSALQVTLWSGLFAPFTVALRVRLEPLCTRSGAPPMLKLEA
jgi:hypothetical protein